MYILPLSDTKAIAVDDAAPDTWPVHVVDFETRTIETFSVDGLGSIQSAHFDHGRGLLWVIADGTIMAIQLAKQEMFEIDMPEDRFTVYSMVGEGSHLYISGEYSNLWRMSLPAMEWEPLLKPEPKPEDDGDYARKYPPYYHGFQLGDDYVFCGALGALARVRGTTVETKRIESGPRLV